MNELTAFICSMGSMASISEYICELNWTYKGGYTSDHYYRSII